MSAGTEFAADGPMSPDPPGLQLSSHYWVRSRFEVPEAAYLGLVEAEGLRRLWFEQLSLDHATTVAADELDGEIEISRRTDAGELMLLRHGDGTVSLVDLTRGSATIEVAGVDAVVVQRRRDLLAAQLGATEPPADEVPITFWATGCNGPRSARRRINAPEWEAVSSNYETSTAEALASIVTISADAVPDTGRLLLWHGIPGAGKTSALRALAREWAPWCSTHFITDPEGFLGTNTSYLLDVLAANSSPRDRRATPWKLIVLEDSGELLTADAHERTGQALSRLLNVTDGLIGQGMQVIVLVTTNEPLGRLHPAIQRPGRRWCEIEFRHLPAEQANAWLDARSCPEQRAAPTALADLYALLRGERVAAPRPVGFAAT